MRYVKSAVITLLFRGAAIPVGMASSIIAERHLGPSGRGVLTLLVVIEALACQVGLLGFN